MGKTRTRTVTSRKTAVKRPVRFKGIGQDAAHLGVTRIHLWLVLTGKRPSAALTARYRELQALKERIKKAA